MLSVGGEDPRRLAVVFFCGGIFFLLERIRPIRRLNYRIGKRLLVNGIFSFSTFLVARFLVIPAAFFAIEWSEEHSFGILRLFDLPSWIEVFLGCLLLDLSFYYWHRLNHVSGFLWRFHNVHHFDPDLDITTGFRFHFVEVALSTVFRVMQVSLIGVGFPVFFLYEMVFQVATYFHHSNVMFPKWMESCLSGVIVTPRMHSIHHSQERTESMSNFSVVFSCWDRVHRTLLSSSNLNNLKIGVPGYSKVGDFTLRGMVFAPFMKQRNYWVKA